MASHFYFITDEGHQYVSFEDDKSGWQKKNFPGLPLTDKNIWIHVEFEFTEDKTAQQALFIAALGSYTAWWDGERLGQNGIVGDSRATETPGQIEWTLPIPSSALKQGKHLLSLQFSAHHNAPDQGYGMFWTFLTDIQIPAQQTIKNNVLPLLMCGALILLSCYCVIHYVFSQRQKIYLIFSGLSVAIVILYAAESWRSLWGYSYEWHIPRLQLVLVLTVLIANLLVIFFSYLFNFWRKEKWLWSALLICVQAYFLASFEGYDATSLYVFVASIAVSLLICARAIWLKMKYAILMFFGLLVFLAPVLINTHFYMEQYFFISFGVLVMLMLGILSQSIQHQKQALLQSELTASRLQLELVKRNVQPHFILNTLTAVEEWIEQSPHTAIQFVQALADEFRHIAQLSNRTLIAFSQEVALCNTHLKVMEYRSQSKYTFQVDAPNSDFCLPPGTLLTLIENALTHNRYGNQRVLFNCHVTTQNERVAMTFSSPANKTKDMTKSGINSGLGHEYIVARLDESFFSEWKFAERYADGYWISQFSFPLIACDKISDVSS